MADEKRIEQIKSLALFSHLSDARLEQLSQFLKELRFSAGDVIFEEGSHGDSLFLVAEGQVRIEKKVAAEKGLKELALLSSGDFFGEMALIEETPRSARAVAHADVRVLMLSRKELFEWLNSQPVMALGFFVELLRVFSQRLRHTTNELALLYDVSHLILGQFTTPAEFLTKLLKHVVPHLEGQWSGAAYVYNPFNEEIERVAVEGPGPLPKALSARESSTNGWIAATTFRADMPGDKGPIGYLVFTNAVPMNGKEKDEISIALSTMAHLVSSALQNIAHRQEESDRARLERQTKGSVSM
jgi:CRP/FNR family transcriptional regulator, cyclic AMP receptor protein